MGRSAISDQITADNGIASDKRLFGRRLVLINIWNGGIGRADPIAEVLLAQRADIYLLTECSDAEVWDRLQLRVGEEFHAVRVGPYAVLSRQIVLHSHWSVRQKRALFAFDDDFVIGAAENVPGEAERDYNAVTLWAISGTQGIRAPAGWTLNGDQPTFPTTVPVTQADAWLLPATATRQAHWRSHLETDRLAVYASCHLPVVLEFAAEDGTWPS